VVPTIVKASEHFNSQNDSICANKNVDGTLTCPTRLRKWEMHFGCKNNLRARLRNAKRD
jgi:hypothetical protein